MSGWVHALIRETRYALRTLSRTPGFTVTVLVTLALCIGVNSAVFSVIDATLLRPLPFPDGDRLMRLTQIRDGTTESFVAPARLQDWSRLSTTFEAITGYSTENASDTTADLAERIRRARVMPSFVEVWGIAPALGRGFSDAEHRLGGDRVALISEHYWRSRFAADPAVLDRIVRIDQVSYAIVGVMPASFTFPERNVDVWVPEIVDAPFAQFRELVWHTGIGRLAPGVALEGAQADLSLVQGHLGEQYPDTDRAIGVRIVPLKESLVGGTRGSLWLLFGTVSVLLLIACTNISALLLSRAAQREHETALRRSLGASQAAVAMPMLMETVILVGAGTAAGLLVAAGATAAIRLMAPELPRLEESELDARVVLYIGATAVLVAALCAFVPALRSARGAACSLHGSRTQVSPRQSPQWLLVGVQVALSVTLLAGAGLLLRSAEALARVDAGFDPASVLAFRVSASFSEPGGIDARIQRIEATLEELTALPEVEVGAVAAFLPAARIEFQAAFDLVERRGDTEPQMIAELRTVSPGYFETMRIPLLEGDLCRTESEVMVSRGFADRYLPGRSVVGLHLTRELFAESVSRIVGIVGDAREIGLDRESVPTVYVCFAGGVASPWFLVRTRGMPMAAAASIRAMLNEIEPLRAVYDIAPLEGHIGDAYAQDQLRMVLLTVFAATALSLACLGIYGTLSYAVNLRRREVGLRVALGALPGSIVSQFLFKALGAVAVASTVGLALSFVATRLLSGMLYGVSPWDPLTLSGVVVIVMAVAAAAALLPAMRASRIDPMQALREE